MIRNEKYFLTPSGKITDIIIKSGLSANTIMCGTANSGTTVSASPTNFGPFRSEAKSGNILVIIL